jgi:hypothetical protein
MVLEEDFKLDGFLHENCGACGLVYVGLDRSFLEEAVDSGLKFSFFRAQMYSDIYVTKAGSQLQNQLMYFMFSWLEFMVSQYVMVDE